MKTEALLQRLIGLTCEEVEGADYEEGPRDTVYATGTTLRFEGEARLAVQFWRLIRAGRPIVSIFDHRQKYGLPAPIDAIEVLRQAVTGGRVSNASMNRAGDLLLTFDGGLDVEVFNFTGFEIWELRFSDGAGQYSNYALAEE